MKTFKILAATIVLIGFATTSKAITPVSETTIECRNEMKNKLTLRVSQSDIPWDEQKNTEVVAEIYINNDGKTNIVAINGENTYKTLVEKQLKNHQMDKEKFSGKTFICRFQFRKN
ncbi:MAG: hypothetical protein PHU27_00205 [Salinivirgaceae bacterium]|nr:hypothetical protein [Salinivirgaceae bacterium]MDD4746227.1 hypothetical protein [Salinivirgaceae bacterium]MDY0279388.1 hypothetical protein [Salinivirgaceae bacterium]